MLGILFSCLSTITNAQPAFQLDCQEKLIMAEKGDTILLPAGSYQLTQTLSMDRKEDVAIIGAGSKETIISFGKQLDGGEGVRITNGKNITLQGLTILDATGDAVKAQYINGITFHDVSTKWTGKPSKKNGAYGLYPVQCENVMIDNCYAFGASDAGIYVGQSDQVIVRNSIAEGNVAGIEIENTTNAEVYGNIARGNTGGILIFDLPDLEKKKGGHIKVYQNEVIENNYKNFAPKGNIVAQVPPGTGIMIMATSNVEIFDNKISNNRTINSAVMSYYIAEIEIKDPAYDPYPSRVYIYDNQFERKKKWPLLKNKFGWLFLFKFGKKVPNIVYDGIAPDKATDTSGRLIQDFEICIKGNTGETFANLDAANKFKQLTRDISLFQCQ
jgi:parallel beta-helix repeat protein